MNGPGKLVDDFVWATLTGKIKGIHIVFIETERKYDHKTDKIFSDWYCYEHDRSTWGEPKKDKSPLGFGNTMKDAAEDAFLFLVI